MPNTTLIDALAAVDNPADQQEDTVSYTWAEKVGASYNQFSTERNPTQTFGSAGEKIIRHQITDALGTRTVEKTITLEAVTGGYVFGAAASDVIDCGAGVPKAGTFSFLCRFKLAAVNGSDRKLAFLGKVGVGVNAMLNASSGLGNNTLGVLFTKNGFTGFPSAGFLSGFAAGEMHTVIGVYDGAHLMLYADADATPKSSVVETGTPDQPSDAHLFIGNEDGGTTSAAGTIYEVGWFPGVVLSGAQCAQLGGGSAAGISAPAHYWALRGDATARFGGHDGTVTGATPASDDDRMPLWAAA